MSLPPCASPGGPDPHGPGGCTCARSRQWVGHSHTGPSALFANFSRSTVGPLPIPLPQIPLTTLHHAPHESHESHDFRKFHGTHAIPNIQNTLLPHMPLAYNNMSPICPQCQIHYFHPSPHVAPVAPQLILSPSKGRKRESSAEGRDSGGCKRQRVPAPIVAAPICSVGSTIPVTSLLSDNDSPSSSQLTTTTVQPPTKSLQAPSASTPLRTPSYSSLRANRKSKGRSSSSSATDVWYFCRTSNSELKPAGPPPDQEPILEKKPCSPYVACKLCKEWRVYKNTDGITTTLRTHLKQHHSEVYEKVVSVLKLKHSDDLDHPTVPTTPSDQGPFELDEWIGLMIRWIVTDDQAINVVESKKFREFILYGLEDHVTERDLPDRTKLIELIFKAYEEEHQKLFDHFKSALGRISFTSDCWSDPNLPSFLALTAHFMARDMNGRLVLQNHLLAFRVVEGKPDGKNFARIIFEILKEADLLGKIGEFTLNNASNSDTLIEALEELFRAAGIVFCRYGHRVQCFPHVVNIAVQTILEELEENGYDPVIATSADPMGPGAKLIEYATAVESDPVGRTRGIVAMCRKSGQRREDMKKVINAGNSCNAWGPDVVIRPVQLLRDCETCWYSTFNMVDRLIELYPLVRHFLSQPAMSEHLFKTTEYEVLGHIHQILEIPHKCQELLAVEKMPTLALALPTYEALVVLWKELAEAIPELSHYIGLGIAKITEYVLRGRSRIYALAMIINPMTKFKWIEEHWSPSERADAERWMEEVMLAYCRARRLANAVSQPAASRMGVPSAGNGAVITQAQRWANFFNLSTARRIVSLPSATRFSSSTPTPSTSSTTKAEKAAREAEDQARDLCTVRNELRRYKEEPPPPDDVPLDLVRYWNDSETIYPLIFKVALDVLPVQASAVSCERVYSSGKETCVPQRSLLPEGMFEVLQVLKHVYEAERLDFTSHWIANEDDYSI